MSTDPLDLLFGDYRRKLLAFLIIHPDDRFHVRDLARQTGVPVGSLHRELVRLANAGLLLRETSGNQVYYHANKTSPYYKDLCSMLTKAISPEFITASRPLDRLARKYNVKKLSLFGSMARGVADSDSDIDFLVEFKSGQSPGLAGLAALKRELSSLYGGRPVDVATPAILKNPYRRKSINADLKVLYVD